MIWLMMIELTTDPDAFRQLQPGDRVLVSSVECIVEQLHNDTRLFLTTADSKFGERPEDSSYSKFYRHVRVETGEAIVRQAVMVEALRTRKFKIG